MDLTVYVNKLGQEFADLTEAGGPEARALVEQLTGALDSAIRLTLLEALSAAADEITIELAPGSVELRLRGRDPDFVVKVPPPAEPLAEPAEANAEDGVSAFADDGPSARINVRLPEQLKAAIEEVAATEGRSVNAWLVRAATAALRKPDRAQSLESPSGGRGQRRFTGWVH